MKNLNLPLRYMIGVDDVESIIRLRDMIVELPYDAPKTFTGPPPLPGPVFGYINALDEEYDNAIFGDKHRYGPYAKAGDTAEDWNEGQLIVGSGQWAKCLHDQCERWQPLEPDAVEIDNPDSYTLEEALQTVDLVASFGFNIVAKNPHEIKGDHARYVAHPSVVGMIVEAGCGNAMQNDGIRRAANKPDLPIWFVHNRAERSQANSRASEILQHSFKRMSVSWSSSAEDYASSIQLLGMQA